MHIILSLFPNVGAALSAFWFIFSRGGWVAFVIMIIFILHRLYYLEVVGQFLNDQKWTFLLVKVPRENLTSLLATEQIFSQLHSLHSAYNWGEVNLEGKVQLWYSFEIVSLGGKISLIMRIPAKMRDNVEAAWYAQYPSAEITEVNDYLENVDYHPGHSDFDIFGFEMKILQDEAIPVKTYRDFEHPSAEVTIIDPLASIFESLATLQPHEFYGIQIIAEPLADPEWKDKSEAMAKKLLGEKVPEPKAGWFGLLHDGLQFYNPIKLLDAGEKKEEKKNESKNDLLNMTEMDKERVNLIQRKAGKPGYRTKIRLLYMAPKDKMDGSKKAVMIGAFRTLGNAQTNGFKPDTKETWTDIKSRLSPSLEKPYIEYEINRRKHHFWNGYKGRSNWVGLNPFILNIEELATIYHLPLSGTVGAAPVEKVDSKKSQAPINLPVG